MRGYRCDGVQSNISMAIKINDDKYQLKRSGDAHLINLSCELLNTQTDTPHIDK